MRGPGAWVASRSVGGHGVGAWGHFAWQGLTRCRPHCGNAEWGRTRDGTARVELACGRLYVLVGARHRFATAAMGAMIFSFLHHLFSSQAERSQHRAMFRQHIALEVGYGMRPANGGAAAVSATLGGGRRRKTINVAGNSRRAHLRVRSDAGGSHSMVLLRICLKINLVPTRQHEKPNHRPLKIFDAQRCWNMLVSQKSICWPKMLVPLQTAGKPLPRSDLPTRNENFFFRRTFLRLRMFFFFTRLFSDCTTTVQVPGMASTGSQQPTHTRQGLIASAAC